LAFKSYGLKYKTALTDTEKTYNFKLRSNLT
jgi:hypothetical protein